RAAASEDGAERATARRGQTVRAGARARGPGNRGAARGSTRADNGRDGGEPARPGRRRRNDTHRARAGPRVG
ncbi:3-methyladenine DNA glycosylase, partial [Mycobacterium tuberculosis]